MNLLNSSLSIIAWYTAVYCPVITLELHRTQHITATAVNNCFISATLCTRTAINTLRQLNESEMYVTQTP